jgi:hypothetical protein
VLGDEGPHLGEGGGAVDGPVGFFRRGGWGGRGWVPLFVWANSLPGEESCVSFFCSTWAP